MANESMEYDIIVNNKKALNSIDKVEKAQEGLDKTTSRTTKTMSESWVVMGAQVAAVGAAIAMVTNEAMELEKATFGLSDATKEYIRWASEQYQINQDVIAGFVQTSKSAGLAETEISKLIDMAVALGRKYPNEDTEEFVNNLIMLNRTGEAQGFIVDILEQKWGKVDLATKSVVEKMKVLEGATKGVNNEYNKLTSAKVDKEIQKVKNSVTSLGEVFLNLLDSSGALYLFNKGVLLLSTSFQGLTNLANITKIGVKQVFGMDVKEDIDEYNKGVDKARDSLDKLLGKVREIQNSKNEVIPTIDIVGTKPTKDSKEEQERARELNKLKQMDTEYWDSIIAKEEEANKKRIEAAKLVEQEKIKAMEKTKRMQEAIVDTMSDAVTEFVFNSKFSFKSMLEDISKMLVKLGVQRALTGVISSFSGVGLFHTGTPQVKHTGGPITSYHTGNTRTDERMAKLQVGEAIVNRAGAKLNQESISKMNMGLKVGESKSNITTADITFNVTAIDAVSFNSYLVREKRTIESIINTSLTQNGSVKRTITQVM